MIDYFDSPTSGVSALNHRLFSVTPAGVKSSAVRRISMNPGTQSQSEY